jgi:D-3-phosphoglycerate dehydrogenase
MALTVDSSVDADLLSTVAEAIGSSRGSIADLRGEE